MILNLVYTLLVYSYIHCNIITMPFWIILSYTLSSQVSICHTTPHWHSMGCCNGPFRVHWKLFLISSPMQCLASPCRSCRKDGRPVSTRPSSFLDQDPELLVLKSWFSFDYFEHIERWNNDFWFLDLMWNRIEKLRRQRRRNRKKTMENNVGEGRSIHLQK